MDGMTSDFLAPGENDRIVIDPSGSHPIIRRLAERALRISSRALHLLLTFLALFGLMCATTPDSAFAQADPGFKGWAWNGVYYATPTEACYAQWDQYYNPQSPNSRFIGALEGSDPTRYSCSWTTYQYLCQQETGGGINGCGTILPSFVSLSCYFGYVAIAGNLCIPAVHHSPERCDKCEPANNGGSPHPLVGDPIALQSGANMIRATDFATDDGRFALSRSYRSKLFGRNLTTQNAAFGPSKGLGGNWNFDFAYEMHLTSASQTPSNPYAFAGVVLPSGIVYAFRLDSAGVWQTGVSGEYYRSRDNYKLEMLGTLPADLSTLKNSSTQWRLTDPHDRVWLFQTFKRPRTSEYSIGRPISMTERDGYTWTFTYDPAIETGRLQSITDSDGRTASFEWRRFDLTWIPGVAAIDEAIKTVGLPDGTSLHYTYDTPELGVGPGGVWVAPTALKMLKSFEHWDANGGVVDSTRYQHDNVTYPALVTSVKDHRGETVASYSHGFYGALTTSTEGGGGANKYTVAYGWTNSYLTATATNALGKTEVYTFGRYDYVDRYDYRIQKIAGAASANTLATQRDFTFSSSTFLATETDELGRKITYTRDTRGRPLTVTEATATSLARITTYTYDPIYNVPATIARDGLSEAFGYSSGRLTSLTQTDTTAIAVPYATNGRTRRWAYTRSPTGQPLTVDGPLPGTSDTVTMTYGTSGTMNGQLATSTNELGHVTQVLSRNQRSQPLSVQDANRVLTNLTYDVLGRPLTVTINPGSTQSQYAMQYDAAGNLTRLTLPMGGWLAYSYDAASRVTRIDNDRGQYQTFVLNALGAPTAEVTKDAGGAITRQSTKAYDELGRLINATGAGGQAWSYAYDKVGNLLRTTDARGKVWGEAVDEHNRVKTATDPQAAQEKLAYEKFDDLKQFKDGRNITTDLVVDGFGRTIRETSPDSGTTDTWFDEADRVTKVTDGDGLTTDYTYDAAGRTLSEVSSGSGVATQTIAYGYDATAGGNYGIGRTTSVSDPSGSSAWVYDAQGRVVQDTRAIGSQTYALAYSYDANGQVTSITYPSGHVVVYNRAADGLVTSVQGKADAGAAAVDLASSVSYLPFGPLASLTYGNGLALTRSYDQNSWLSGIAVTGMGGTLLGISYTRDANGNVTAVTDSADANRNASYSYSNANRLAAASGKWGADSYTYDANGNRTLASRVAGGIGASDVATIAATSNRLTEIRDGAGALAKSFGYTAGGDTASLSVTGSPAWSYSYDARGRLATAAQGGTVMLANSYDFTGQRVARTAAGGVGLSHFVYGADGHLLAEYDGAAGTGAAPVREYIWLDDLLVATVGGPVASPAYRAIVTGHQDEVVLETLATQALIASLTRDPWGNVITLAGSTGLQTGYPGQLQDSATGLYQNWHRDYDPALGRYIEADPIGLGGGSNRYGYANANPTNLTDPTGEFVPILIGIGIGVGLEYITNPCATWQDLVLAGALGGIGGGLGQLRYLRYGPRSLTRVTGHEWSHAIPKRWVNRFTSGAMRKALNKRGGTNGSWVRPERAFRQDPFRYPKGWNVFGKRYYPILRPLDRIPDWLKASATSGAIGSAASNSDDGN